MQNEKMKIEALTASNGAASATVKKPRPIRRPSGMLSVETPLFHAWRP